MPMERCACFVGGSEHNHTFFLLFTKTPPNLLGSFTNIGPLRPESNAYQGRAHTSSPPQLPIPGVLGLWVVRETQS
jgi:hypothetical protein